MAREGCNLSERSGRRRDTALAFGVAIAVLTLVQLVAPARWKTWDATDYRPAVASLEAGRPFLDSSGSAMVRYAPLFPLLLFGEARVADATGISRTIISQAVAVILVAFSAALLYSLLLDHCDRRTATVLAASSLLLPHLLWGMFRNLSVVAFLPLLVLSIGSILRQLHHPSGRPSHRPSLRLALVSGALLGLATLVRPIALYLPIVFAMFLCARGGASRPRRLAAAGLVVAGMVVALAPWQIWIYAHGKHTVTVTSSTAASLRDGISLNHKSWRDRLPQSPRLKELQQRVSAEYASFETSTDVVRFLASEFKRDPLAVSQLFALKAARSWYGLDSQDQRRERWLRWFALLYLLPTSLAAGAWLRALRHWARLGETERSAIWTAGLLLAVVGYFWAMTTLATTVVRYMVPALFLLPLLWVAVLPLLRLPSSRPRQDPVLSTQR